MAKTCIHNNKYIGDILDNILGVIDSVGNIVIKYTYDNLKRSIIQLQRIETKNYQGVALRA
jgi:hypothetical protein